MPARRIVACLDVRGGRTVKGTQFRHLADAGDPAELAGRYCTQGADEIVVLDIAATTDGAATRLDTIRAVASMVDIPLTAGGGVRSIADVDAMLQAGADKVALNTAAVRNPSLVTEAARRFGTQCVVVAIDAIKTRDGWVLRTHAGAVATGMDAVAWARTAQDFGAGELVVTSIDRDGTGSGFDCELLRAIKETVTIPVVASGGAATPRCFADAFLLGRVDAALGASMFHYQKTSIGAVKEYLALCGIEVRPC